MIFSENAYDRLMRTSPELTKYILSFVDLSTEVPENFGIELGVFILGSGSGVNLYVPVVSKGGNIFPIDSLFDPQEGMFFPMIESYVQSTLLSAGMNPGRAVTIPSNVNQNPNLRRLIDPPRTGKHAYAGTMVAEAAAQLSPAFKKAMLEKVASDKRFGLTLQNSGINLRDLTDALQHVKSASETVTVKSTPIDGLKVIVDGSDLPHDVVQSILNNGYGYLGDHDNPRLVVQYDAVNDGYTKMDAGLPGQVYEVVMKDGSLKAGFIAPRIRSIPTILDNSQLVNKAAFKPVMEETETKNLESKVIIFEDGTYMNAAMEPVIKATSVSNLNDMMLTLADQGKILDIYEVSPDLKGEHARGFIITPSGWIGPLSIYKRSQNETGVTLHVSGQEGVITHIHVSRSMAGNLLVSGTDIFVNGNAAFLVAKMSEMEPETNVGTASIKRNNVLLRTMQPLRVSRDGLDYYVNGQHVGDVVNFVKRIAEGEMFSKQASELMVKRAQHESTFTVYVSRGHDKSAANITDPNYVKGFVPEADNQTLPNMSNQQPNIDFAKMEQAAATGDKGVLESTIIAEFVNDPDMFETIGNYLPCIRESVDKIGRSIFLLRLNINSVSEQLEPGYLSGIMTSLRNTYRNLGDSYLKLKQVSASSQETTITEGTPTGEVV